ncbi:hypothetical protein HAX54_027614 [Datura stramonium]|uniref:Uncharacterized protein n=1 Tax=Datura stramonium TaxID=4076 RepID=A0ABS8S8V9_DATST|nr:hypothetical protein [Datura stramonium]
MNQVPQYDRGCHRTGTPVLWPARQVGRPRQGEAQHGGMYGTMACATHKIEEAQLADIARRAEAAQLAAALVERNRYNPPRHHRLSAVQNALFEWEYDQE